MAKNLVIVESPTKSKTISKFLGSSFVIKASMGHIRDLPKTKLGVDVKNDFTVKYLNDKSKTKIIKELKDEAKKANSIYLASDPDREGEAIAWHITQILKKEIKDKPIHRVVFNEITQKAVQKAINSPKNIDMNMVNSQQARRILDRLVGYEISPLLWKVVTYGLSAGRVQSVALRILCQKEEDIKKFVPQEFWNISMIVKKGNLNPFNVELSKWKNKKAVLNSKKEVDNFLEEISDSQAELHSITSRDKKVYPSPPYITSTLQMAASIHLGFSSKKTMIVAQKLYEGIKLEKNNVGLITYMRTDSVRMSSDALKQTRELIKDIYGDDLLEKKDRFFKNKKSVQDAHEAIRPTFVQKTPITIKKYLNNEQYRLYNLIWQRFVATQMTPAIVEIQNIQVKVSKAIFLSTAHKVTFDGFTKCFAFVNYSKGTPLNKKYNQKDILEKVKINTLQKYTKPPPRYTEGSLIKELDDKGIGRPSTYASILSTIKDRRYVELVNKKFFALSLGRTINKFLISNFDSFFNVNFTSAMETDLDEIEQGNISWKEFLKHNYTAMSSLISKVNIQKSKDALVEFAGIKCPKCGEILNIKWGKNGQFLACSNYPKCKFSANFKRDASGEIIIKVPEVLDEKCPKCGGEMLIKDSRFGKFIGCKNFPKCRFTKSITLGIKCPECSLGEITPKKGRRGVFYSCTEYPKCKFVTNYKPIKILCPECGNEYMEEKTKKGIKYKTCPKCGKEVI